MVSASAPTLTGNERITRRSPEEVASEGNVGLIDEIRAEDVLDHSPLGEVRRRDKLKAQTSGFKELFNGLSATVEDTVTEGDTVAMRVTLRGTHDGAFMGIESTGKPIKIGNVVFTRIEDGVTAEWWVQPDMLGIPTQLGAVESPAAQDPPRSICFVR